MRIGAHLTIFAEFEKLVLFLEAQVYNTFVLIIKYKYNTLIPISNVKGKSYSKRARNSLLCSCTLHGLLKTIMVIYNPIKFTNSN